ncbi:MAG TPA: dihydropteroate synthase [Caulobacteraceae bacterium]|jgi:dihydropteroate synthase|nr:dihydropteroate synthase [Caulobacteraceae bacterium]
MGVVNRTPDSFSGDGLCDGVDEAIAHARALVAAGADLLDIGAESTRPEARPVEEAVELGRVLPLVEALVAKLGIPISIDTMKPAVARAAIAAGACFWNDVTALRFSPESLAVAGRSGASVVLMHMQGEPRTMQRDPHYDDVVTEVRDFLMQRARAALDAGVAPDRIWLDPGLGFGKRPEQNLALLRGLPAIGELGFPVVVGASRKGLIRALDPSARSPQDRLGGSIALALAATRAGAAMVRVHDVRETVQALKVDAALRGLAPERASTSTSLC